MALKVSLPYLSASGGGGGCAAGTSYLKGLIAATYSSSLRAVQGQGITARLTNPGPSGYLFFPVGSKPGLSIYNPPVGTYWNGLVW